jgi:anti-anti-sigma factor
VESSPHVLLLFHDEAHRQARVASWVQQGLARGEKILYSSVPDDPLVPALALRTGDAQPVRREGQISVVPSEDVFPEGRQSELIRSALDEGYSAVRLTARADAGLSDMSLDEYRVVDELTDELCTSLPVTALCQLDAASASAATLSAVIGMHSGVIEDIQMRVRRRGHRLDLSGEVDSSSAGVLVEALRSACRLETGRGTVIDLSELTFIDASGCRALAVGTEEHRRTGGSVTIRGASGHIQKVLSLLGVDRLAEMALS